MSVLRNDADPIYGVPTTFFKNTYATGGLRNLLSEALGRLTGVKSTNAPVIRVLAAGGPGVGHAAQVGDGPSAGRAQGSRVSRDRPVADPGLEPHD